MDEFSLVRNVALLKPNHKKIMSGYLLWCIKTRYMQSQLLSRRNASAQDALYLNKLKNVKISLPPLSIQQKFSKILNRADYNRKIMDISSREIYVLFESLLQKVFSGKLVT
jgi:restriction endonuclease S subunit